MAIVYSLQLYKMKKEIEILIPNALKATTKFLIPKKPGEKQLVQKEYSGYAASLGAAIRTSGLVACITFYTDLKRKEGNARRYKLLQALAYTLGYEQASEDERFLQNKILRDLYGDDVLDSNLELKPPDRAAEKKWKNDIARASIALKLAMRNFEHSKD